MRIDIRQGRPDDGDAIFRVVESAFRIEPGTPKWHQRKREADRRADEFRVLLLDGKLVSVAHVARDQIQIGSCVISKGDVGEVSTLPAFERRGLATRLMVDVVEWMRAEGFHLSRLGGYCAFYQRFGYVPFPRGLVQFPLTGLHSRAGLTDPEEVLSVPLANGVVRPYDAVRDHGSRARLYQAFNQNRTGAVPRSFGGPPDSGEENPWQVVFERGGEVHGYLFATALDEEHSLFEGKAQIGETAVDPAHPEALAALLRHVLLGAFRHGATRVTARLPLDYSLYRWYRLGSLGFVPMLWESTESGNMLNLLDLTGLLQAIAPELERRLQGSTLAGWQGALRLHVADQAATLERSKDRLYVTDSPVSDAVSLDPADFLHLLLGLASADAIALRPPGIPAKHKALLAALFPRQPTATGVWG
jgi:predicted N-acetyltransferase YhbS